MSSSSMPSLEDIKAIQASPAQISTPLTTLFGCQHPFILAGMNQAASAELAAAVSNAGGIGCIGGVNMSVKMLRSACQDLKAGLRHPDLPWACDLLLPQVGGSARKTNKDYTKGTLMELIDVIIEEGASFFVSAVGIPPREVVDRLHKAGILVANMIGHPKHVKKALDVGVDMLICQGGEAGGHTGNIPTSILLNEVVDLAQHSFSRITGSKVMVIAAGGIYNGRGLAASIVQGAAGVWVGTRMVATLESGAPLAHKKAIVEAKHDSIVKVEIFTGRPLNIVNTEYIQSWIDRPDLVADLLRQGIVPVEWDLSQESKDDDEQDRKIKGVLAHHFAGKCAAAIHDILPAKTVIDTMVSEAAQCLKNGSNVLARL